MAEYTSSYWAVVPAAGVGRRMQADRPKQYLPLLGKTVLEHTLLRLCELEEIRAVVVAVAAQDPYWHSLTLPANVLRATGGKERCHSVLNGLEVLRAQGAGERDWVLVHDAARPCVRVEDIRRLLRTLSTHPVGGLLAVPVRDTMKQAGADRRVERSVDRSTLYHALTPQMFRLGPLYDALHKLLERGVTVTDDAQAMELQGAAPLLVEGSEDNIKITRPRDLALAEFYLLNFSSSGRKT